MRQQSMNPTFKRERNSKNIIDWTSEQYGG